MKLFLPIFIALMMQVSAFAQCDGGDPSVNLSGWDYSLTTEENFNNARREDEIDHALTTGCLGNMTEIPGGWSNASFDEIALYIHNSEREARGILPFHGVETNLDAVAQAHSEWQITNEVFSHGGDATLGSSSSYTICGPTNSGCPTTITGSSPFDRMNQSSPLASQWELESENIAVSVTSGSSISSQLGLVTGLYRFMYVDAGSSWGHRHNMLNVYNDNWGAVGNEGFIGVGVHQGGAYKSCAFSCGSWNKAAVTTINYYDPQASATNYTFSTVLPVELFAFQATKSRDNVMLNWSTASQQNSEYFVIEKSTNGIDFSGIGYIDIMMNTVSQTDYEFVDSDPFDGANYYRLRIVDYDLKEELSEVVSVRFYDEQTVSIFPNPVRNVVQFEFAQDLDEYQFEIYNLTGQLILSKKIITNAIDIGQIQQGVYLYLIKDAYGVIVKNGQLQKL